MSKYGSVVGVDISGEMVEHCRNIGLNALHESVLCSPFEDRSFDLVLCLDVLEHLPEEKPVLEELKRVVRPGGIIPGLRPGCQKFNQRPQYVTKNSMKILFLRQ